MAGPLPSLKFTKGHSKNPIVPGVCLIDDKFKFLYNKTLSDGNKTPISLFYQCGMKRKTKCPASVVLTKLDERWWPQNLSADEVHNHPSDKGYILAGIMKKEMFSKVSKNPESKADEVYRDVVTSYEDRFGEEEHIWDDVVANLPDKNILARNMRYIRSKEHGPLPKNRNDFDPEAVVKDAVGGRKVIIMDSNKLLDDEFYVKLNDFKNDITEYDEDLDQYIRDGESEHEEESFSEEDAEKSVEANRIVDYSSSSNESGNDDIPLESTCRKNPKRIIAYSTKKLLKIFNQRKSSGDGTFKICPALWKQLYIVMVKFGNSWIPVCYALLPDKCKETYFTFFYMVRKQIKSMKMDFNLGSMITDFEIGAMKAAAAAWKVAVKGCYYHFTQSGWRFVQNNNMASAYLSVTDQEFKLLIRCILSLPHVPLDDLGNTLELLSDKDWDFGDSVEKEEFKDKILNYVKDYWVNGQIPPQVWNCFYRKVDLTNNNNESHNNYLNNAIKESHPSPASLTVALVKELTLAETKYRKVRSGAKRVVKKTYQNLNERRDNLKKMYRKMDRLDYLSQVGNIVMHIQLNQGQMTELQNAKDKQREIPTEESDNDPENPLESSHDSFDSDVENAASSDQFNSTGADATLSSVEENNPYEDRMIGKVHENGKKTNEYEVPEYKNKKCLACKGKFNIRSKYQVCKLCDEFIHVNNNKKCHKMKKYSRDENFVCFLCSEESQEPRNEESESTSDPENEEVEATASDRPDQILEDTDEFYRNLTIDGFQCDGLVFETVGAPEEVSDNDTSTELEQQCIHCSFETDTEKRMHFHMISAHRCIMCHVCAKTFTTEEEMKEHIDEVHYNPCTICERVFLRSLEKKDHIEQDHREEGEFRSNIQRQSTAVRSRSFSKIAVEFVADVESIKDLKKKRRKGS